MRKLYLVVASCVALVAFMGLSATAFAVIDSDCVPNDVEIQGFTVTSLDSSVSGEVSGINGAGRACGSEIENGGPGEFPGEGTLFKRADITIPAGVVVAEAPSAQIPVDSYVGEAQIDVLFWADFGLLTVATDIPDLQPSLITRPKSECQAERNALGDGGSEADIVACYYGEITGFFHFKEWNWVVDDGNGELTLTIGEFHNLTQTHVSAGLTEIDRFDLCAYAGTVGGNSCGDGSEPSKWTQKNGDVSEGYGWLPGYTRGLPIPTSLHRVLFSCDYGSNKGRGIYTVTATNRDGQTTDPVSSCVSWTP